MRRYPTTRSILGLFFMLLVAASPARALMAPDGGMVQLDSFDEAVALVEDEAYDAAIEQLTAVLREYPRHANAWNMLGFSLRNVGRFDEAETAYGHALEITPNHLGALNYRGQMYVQTGRLEDARASLELLRAACDGTCKEFKQLDRAIQDGKVGKY